MKFLFEPLHHFRGEFGIQGVHLARFARRQVDDKKRDDGHEKERDGLLNDASSNERKHVLLPLPVFRRK